MSQAQSVPFPRQIGLPAHSVEHHLPAFAPEGPRGPQERLSSRRVLIAEDDHLVSVEIEAALLDAGFEVTGVAISVEEAIEHARRQIPDLVVMDIRLVGDGDGVDAALELFREHGIRCLFATAHIDSAMRRRAEPARPLGWIAKPYDPRLLVKAVERAFHALERE